MGEYDTYRDIIMYSGPVLHHKPMDIIHRAKQFAPFAALKGLEETVHGEELIYADRKELSEDRAAELNLRLKMVRYGMEITAAYFVADLSESGKGHYEIITGQAAGCVTSETLVIEDRKIPIKDLYDLTGDDLEKELQKETKIG